MTSPELFTPPRALMDVRAARIHALTAQCRTFYRELDLVRECLELAQDATSKVHDRLPGHERAVVNLQDLIQHIDEVMSDYLVPAEESVRDYEDRL